MITPHCITSQQRVTRIGLWTLVNTGLSTTKQKKDDVILCDYKGIGKFVSLCCFSVVLFVHAPMLAQKRNISWR